MKRDELEERYGAMVGVKEVARALGLSHWTIRAWIRRGELSHMKLGNRYLLPQREVEQIVRQRMKTGRIAEQLGLFGTNLDAEPSTNSEEHVDIGARR